MSFWEVYSYFYDLSLKNLFPYRQLLQDLNDALGIKGGEKILDAGCGPGFVIEKAVKENEGKGISILGIDSSKAMIKRAYSRCGNLPGVELQVVDLDRNLDFPDNCFDKVVCSNTLYALGNPRSVVSELYRVSKPGAAVIIANPKPNAGERELIRDHLRTLGKVTPFYRKVYDILTSVLLIPVNIVIMIINKVIIRRAKTKEYHFLDKEELQGIFQEVGFVSTDISSCYADQDWLVRAEKQG